MKRIYLALMALVGPVMLGSCEGLAELETHLDIAVGEDNEGGGDGDKKGTSIGFGVSVGFGNDGPDEDDAVLEYEDIIPPEIILSSNVQGGDCWGDYFFQFGTNNTRIRIYDLALKTYSQNVYLSNGLTGFVPNCHCNTVAFGTEYYDAGDPFPLIYVSTGYGVDGYTGALVYRIKRNYLGTFSVSLVQTIYRMEMPKLKDGDLVTLDPSQALETYLFPPRPSWMGTSRNQDYLFRDGKLYFITGTSQGFSGLVVLDLGTRKWERIINFKKNGLTSEPESIFVWQGDICVALKDRMVKLHL